MWNYILKKIFDFDSEIAIPAIENSEEGKDKKMKVQGLERSGSSVCRVSVVNVCSENDQMQTNGFCPFIITYYLFFLS